MSACQVETATQLLCMCSFLDSGSGAAWLVPEQNGEVPAAPPGQLGSRLGTVGGGMATRH